MDANIGDITGVVPLNSNAGRMLLECGWFYGSAFVIAVRREVRREAVLVINGHGMWPAGAGTAQGPVIGVRWLVVY